MGLDVRQPESVYATLDVTQYRRVYVVGDLHGKLTELNVELDAVEFDRSQDFLISVGDIIDRGRESPECLELLKEPWFTMVRGNHEDFAIASVEDTDEIAFYNWLRNGGVWFLNTEIGPERKAIMETISKCGDLPYILEVITHDQCVVIAHACYPYLDYEYGKKVDTYVVVWDRDLYHKRQHGEQLITTGADLLIHGHNHNDVVEHYGNHVYIATGMSPGTKITLYKIQG